MEKKTASNPLCPRCGKDTLFEENHQYFCSDCLESSDLWLFVCPFCLRAGNLTGDSESFCEHYLTEEGGDSDYLSDADVWNRIISLEDASSGAVRDASSEAEEVWTDEVWELASSALDALSDQEKTLRFGPLYPFLEESFGVRKICHLLDISIDNAYFDDNNYVNVYFAEMRGAAAWERVSPAIEHYRQGLQWLERHARELG